MQEKNTGSLLKWRCRRGMLELDLILIPFYEQCYAELTPTEKLDFVDLLECTDPELQSWIMGYNIPQNEHIHNLITKIRRHARLLD